MGAGESVREKRRSKSRCDLVSRPSGRVSCHCSQSCSWWLPPVRAPPRRRLLQRRPPLRRRPRRRLRPPRRPRLRPRLRPLLRRRPPRPRRLRRHRRADRGPDSSAERLSARRWHGHRRPRRLPLRGGHARRDHHGRLRRPVLRQRRQRQPDEPGRRLRVDAPLSRTPASPTASTRRPSTRTRSAASTATLVPELADSWSVSDDG